MINKILHHWKKGTLVETSMNYLRVNILIKKIKIWKESMIFNYYKGVFEIPLVNAAYKKEAANSYNLLREKTDSWISENKVVAEYLNKIPDALKVLDVPFGTGRFIDFYSKKNYKVTGLDKSKEMIEAANTSLGEKLKQCDIIEGDATNLPFNKGFFDLVVCFRFLPHIINYQDAQKVINEASRVSNKYVILQLGVRPEKIKRRRTPNENEKMGTWFYLKEIIKLLENNNLKIIESSEVVHPGVTMDLKYFKNPGGWHVFLCEKLKK